MASPYNAQPPAASQEQLAALARQVAYYVMASNPGADQQATVAAVQAAMMAQQHAAPAQTPAPAPPQAPQPQVIQLPAPQPQVIQLQAPQPQIIQVQAPPPQYQPQPQYQAQYQPQYQAVRVAQPLQAAQQPAPKPAAQPPPAAPKPAPAQPPPPPPPPAKPQAFRASFQAGDAALRAKGEIAPVATIQGVKAYVVTFQKGKRGGDGSNMNALLAPAAVFPAEQCRVRFKLWFEKGFPWDPKTMKAVGGKLLGFEMGKGPASGGEYSNTGASMRIMWAKNGGAGPYFYPQLRKAESKKKTKENVSWGDLDQTPDFRKVAYIATGVHMFYPGNKNDADIRKWDLKFLEDKWNEVELYVKLNTPGKSDGVVEMTLNGKTRRFDQMRYRYDSSVKINGVKIHPFFGGGTLDFAPTHTCKAAFADFAFA